MARRKLRPGETSEKPYREIITGGPTKYFNRRRVRNLLYQKPTSTYEPISAEWYKQLIDCAILDRHRLNMSQMTLAHRMGTTQSEISQFETGKANPTVEFLGRLMSILRIRIEIK